MAIEITEKDLQLIQAAVNQIRGAKKLLQDIAYDEEVKKHNIAHNLAPKGIDMISGGLNTLRIFLQNHSPN